MLIFSLVIY